MQFWAIYDRPGAELHHVSLTISAQRDEDIKQWVGTCQELEVSSQGDSLGDAIDETIEATLLYLDTIEELGERKRVFEERGVRPEFGVPDLESPPLHESSFGVTTTHVYVGHPEHVPA